MGVDIHAYLNVVRDLECPIEAKFRESCENKHLQLYNLSCFDERAPDFEDAENNEKIVRYGCFTGERLLRADAEKREPWQRGEAVHMSYSAYNRWRELLSVAINGETPEQFWERIEADGGERIPPAPTLEERTPFGELINFADNEGTISWTVAARLSTAFADPKHRARFEEAARAMQRPGDLAEWDVDAYDTLGRIFAAAGASRGVVVFS